MPRSQSAVDAIVIEFKPRTVAGRPQAALACLTASDRMDITRWQERAREAGYDRMVVHERDAMDASDFQNFLSVYRRDEAWSRWGFARMGRAIHGWCCLTGADLGQFATLTEALEAVLMGTKTVDGLFEAGIEPSATVISLLEFRFARQLGSAA